MSFATINSISDVYNKMTFIEYLNLTHTWCLSPKQFQLNKSNFTIISLCCSHLMKNLARDIKSYFTNGNHAKIIIEIFSTFFNIINYDVIKDVWKKLCVILKSPFSTSFVQKTLNYLLLQVSTVYKVNEEKIENDDENEVVLRMREATNEFHEKIRHYMNVPHFSKNSTKLTKRQQQKWVITKDF